MSTSGAPSEVRRLYRSRTDRMIAGVCGGIGDYFNVDPTLVRLAFLLLVLANGVGIILYIIGAIIIPLNPTVTPSRGPSVEVAIPSNLVNVVILAIGAVILILGVTSLFSIYAGAPYNPMAIFGFIGQLFWPLALIVVGIIVLIIALGSNRRKM